MTNTEERSFAPSVAMMSQRNPMTAEEMDGIAANPKSAKNTIAIRRAPGQRNMSAKPMAVEAAAVRKKITGPINSRPSSRNAPARRGTIPNAVSSPVTTRKAAASQQRDVMSQMIAGREDVIWEKGEQLQSFAAKLLHFAKGPFSAPNRLTRIILSD